MLKFLRHPRIKKAAVSAVLSSTLPGTLDTNIGSGLRAEHAATSIWSYPAAQWAMKRRLRGKRATSSESMRPVMEILSKVRKAAVHPSKAPDWHSVMKEERSVEEGTWTEKLEVRDCQVSCALGTC